MRLSSDGHALASFLQRYRVGTVPSGAKDGVNLIFVIPEPILHIGTITAQIYLNGQRLKNGDDYTLSESGGPGTGYDTITLIGPAPLSYEHLIVDYIAA